MSEGYNFAFLKIAEKTVLQDKQLGGKYFFWWGQFDSHLAYAKA